MTTFKLPARIAALRHVCEQEPSRYAIDAVQVEQEGDQAIAVATDGRVLLKVELPHGPDQPNAKGSLLIPRQLLDAVAAVRPSGHSLRRGSDLVFSRDKPGHCSCVFDNPPELPRMEIVEPQAEKRFPKWRDVLAAREPAESVTPTIVRLGTLKRIVAALDGLVSDDTSVAIEVPIKQGCPISIRCSGEGKPPLEIEAVLMPCVAQSC